MNISLNPEDEGVLISLGITVVRDLDLEQD